MLTQRGMKLSSSLSNDLYGDAASTDLGSDLYSAEPSYIGQVGQNISSGFSDLGDLANMNYKKPEELGAYANLRAKHQAGTATRQDYLAAFLEGGANSPAGKGLSALNINPLIAAGSAAFQKYINPAIEGATGATPEDVQTAELALPFLAKGVSKVLPDSANAAVNNFANKAMSKPAEMIAGAAKNIIRPDNVRQPLPETLGKFLIEGSPDANMNLGTDTGTALLSKASVAKKAKNEAYEEAKLPSQNFNISSQLLGDLRNQTNEMLAKEQFVPEQVTNLLPIRNNLDNLIQEASDNGGFLPWNRIDAYRNFLNNLSDNGKDAKAKGIARGQFKTFANNILGDTKGLADSNLVNGNMEGLPLLQQAHKLNTSYESVYGRDAPKLISDYIQSEGNMPPENFINGLTGKTQAAFENRQGLIDAVGEEQAKNVVKNALMNNVRSKSLTPNGEIDYSKLGKNISDFVNNKDNQSLIKENLSSEEQGALRAIASYNGKAGAPGLVKWIGRNASRAGFLAGLLGGESSAEGIMGGMIGKGIGEGVNKVDAYYKQKAITNPKMPRGS